MKEIDPRQWGKRFKAYDGDGGYTSVKKLVFPSNHSDLLASLSEAGRVKLWRPSDGKELFCSNFPPHIYPKETLEFNPAGDKAAYMVSDKDPNKKGLTIVAVEGETIDEVDSGYHVEGEICHAAWISDTCLICVYTDNNVILHRLDDGGLVSLEFESGDKLEAIAFDPNSMLLAAGGESGSVYFWKIEQNLSDAELVRSMDCAKGQIESMAFTPDGRLLLITSFDGYLRAYKMVDFSRHYIMNAGCAFSMVSISPDGKIVATGGYWEDWIDLRDVESGRVVTCLHFPEENCYGNAVSSPDGKSLAIAIKDSILILPRDISHRSW